MTETTTEETGNKNSNNNKQGHRDTIDAIVAYAVKCQESLQKLKKHHGDLNEDGKTGLKPHLIITETHENLNEALKLRNKFFQTWSRDHEHILPTKHKELYEKSIKLTEAITTIESLTEIVGEQAVQYFHKNHK